MGKRTVERVVALGLALFLPGCGGSGGAVGAGGSGHLDGAVGSQSPDAGQGVDAAVGSQSSDAGEGVDGAVGAPTPEAGQRVDAAMGSRGCLDSDPGCRGYNSSSSSSSSGCGSNSGSGGIADTGAGGSSGGGGAGSGEGGAEGGSDASNGNSAPSPSCGMGGAGRTDCGATGESCCTSLEVPGGTFYRSYDVADGGPTNLADPATVSAFRLDKYDVTVGRFRSFVDAVLPADGGPGWLPPEGSGKHTHLNGGRGLANSAIAGTYETGWASADNASVTPTTSNLTTGCQDPSYATWTASVGSHETLPITCVNWWEAYAFCIWDGGFLPSEAEWEFAAAGGDEQRLYPWGATDPGMSNQYAIYLCNYPHPLGPGKCTDVSDIAPVGTATLGAGRWGQLDLAGNVWQLSLDGKPACGNYVNPCADCAQPSEGSDQWYSGGGSFFAAAVDIRPSPSLPYYASANLRDSMQGFRCARSP